MTVIYRLAEPDDAEALAVMHTRSWQAGYRGLIDQDFLDSLDPHSRTAHYRESLQPEALEASGTVWILAEAETGVAGHVCALRSDDQPDRGYLGMLYVDPDYWGQGIGARLHDMALRAFARMGYDQAYLKVLDGNERAQGFYQRRGWQRTERRFVDTFTSGGHSVELVDWEMVRSTSLDVLLDNRTYWNEQAPSYGSWAGDAWDRSIPTLGIFNIDGTDIFPEVTGADVVELGCGTGYVSGWCLQRGAQSVVGIDNAPGQLATAARLATEREANLPLIFGDAHRLPFADGSFDVAISEYGAAIWCDPRIWIPEAARVLRPGGRLWFLGNSTQMMLCAPEFEGEPAEPRMVRPQRGMHRFAWLDTNGVEYHVSPGEMIAILTGAGFVVDALHELYAEPDQTTSYDFVDASWASKWPFEHVWVAHLPAS
jgi:SAM-dependent methyltransferase